MSVKTITHFAAFNGVVKLLIMGLAFFLGIHFQEIGLSGTQIGMIFAVNTMTSIITILPAGFSNDRFKSKHLITFALVALAIEYLGISFTQEFPIIMGLFLLGGIGSTLYASSSDSLFYKSTNKKDISKKIGIYHSINYLMVGAGMIGAGYLKELSLSYEQIFQIVASGLLVMAIISHFALPNNITTKLDFIKYKKDLLQKKVIYFLIIMFLFSFHFGAESTAYGLFLKHELLLSPSQMGLYMGIAIISMAIAVTFISKYLHKIKAKYVLLMGLFVSGSGHILMTFKPTLLSAGFRIYHEIGDAAMFFFLYYGITKLFDLKRIGGNASIFNLTLTFGGAIGAMAFGPMGETFGYNTPLIVSGATSLVAFILAVQFLHHFDH